MFLFYNFCPRLWLLLLLSTITKRWFAQLSTWLGQVLAEKEVAEGGMG